MAAHRTPFRQRERTVVANVEFGLRNAPRAGFGALIALALLVGIGARVAHLERKTFFQDEAYSALRITGHTEDAYLRLFDGTVRPLADVNALVRLDSSSSPLATVRSIAREEPQRGPLYYAAAAQWVRFAGTSVAGFRSLSVAIGLLEIATAFWFGRELFGRGRGGAILAALVAVSPFHLRYAQQAREYGLLGVAIFASSACLLRALRPSPGAVPRWIAYALSCALGLAVSPFFALVIASHTAYVAYATLARACGRRAAVRYACATVAAAGATSPWFFYASRAAHTVRSQTQWGASPYPPLFAAAKWAFNVGATFFDYEFADVRYAVVLAVLLPLLVCALVATVRSERATAAFVCALALPTLAVFLLVDYSARAHYATIPRYLTPVWIALEVALAQAVSRALRAGDVSRRYRWGAAFAFVVACGIWSAIGGSGATTWWDNNDNEPTAGVAAAINAEAQPLVATSNVAITLSLARYLRPDASVELFARRGSPAVLPRGVATFLFLPTAAQRLSLERRRQSVRNVAVAEPSVVGAFHAALERERPSAESRSLIELSAQNALWRLAVRPE